MGDLALIDYCLRAIQDGMRVVTVPDARVRTIEQDHAINDLPAIWRLRQAWRRTFRRDPYYNPNYRQDRGDFKPHTSAIGRRNTAIMIGILAPSHWQMTFGERAAIEGILAQLRPRVAIEIGTAEGGSLERIAHYSERVHSFDLVTA